MSLHLRCVLFAVLCSCDTHVVGQQLLETVEVVGTTPLGLGLDVDRIASNTQIATSEDLRERGALDLTDFINRTFVSVSINEAQNNPLQPDIRYRGFVGSPLLGLPQGIAVYQDAVRINEPFGDTVNWALIPQSAIDTIHLIPGSNPLFGLNALGGAISIRTKDGFTHQSNSVAILGGSFSRIKVEAETGGQVSDDLGYFVTASHLEEDGWRNFSPTDATQLFSKLTWQLDQTRIDTSLSLIDTDLVGNGAAPIELLSTDRQEIFTRPDRTQGKLTQIITGISHTISDQLSLTGNVYARHSDTVTHNGDDSDFEECESSPHLICRIENGDEEIVLDLSGIPVPINENVEGATINRTNLEQNGFGISLQLDWETTLVDRENQFIVGIGHDKSNIEFLSNLELGSLDATRKAIPSGFFVGDSFTRLKTNNENASLYFSDIFSASDAMAITISGRYNRTRINLRDQLGTALSGNHEFERFNPALGLTYRFTENKTFFASYSESNRAPSPVELTCADENDPCRLPNAFLADPPLAQAIAKTYEVGIRGIWTGGNWSAGTFLTTNSNDILFISAGTLTNEGFFDNVGQTQRKGLELSINNQPTQQINWFANYSYLKAVFRENFAVPSPNNPAAIEGRMSVKPGDRLPLIPDHLLKVGGQISVTEKFSINGDLLATSGQYLRGDESNLMEKTTPYMVINARLEYRLNEGTIFFLAMNNLLDEKYETFGLFGEPSEVLGENFKNNRFLSPGAPRAAWLGLRMTF